MAYIPVADVPAKFASEIADKIGAVRGEDLQDLLPKGAKIPEGYSLVNIEEANENIDAIAEGAKEQFRIQQSKTMTRFGFGGLIVGVALGGAAGYFLTRRRLETKYNKITEDEIAEMRQHYRDKTVALENTAGKPELESLVREQGYSTEPPMAVTPPDAVVERAETVAEEESSDPRPPVPVVREENVFRQPEPTQEELGMVEDNWDMVKERSRRTSNRPYVIHIDEVRESDEYDMVTYTYYEEDDVLCNELDEVIGKGIERETLIGEANLNRFGHGSGDPSKVYIRNDHLEMQ
ncbi:MAG TPA: YtxH domain-containing protein, partial [Candidatus Nitrosocosmicus sp.]|nr:YtxH domain-containing protein [Candidatus Nitrosocosmicus sp.]